MSRWFSLFLTKLPEILIFLFLFWMNLKKYKSEQPKWQEFASHKNWPKEQTLGSLSESRYPKNLNRVKDGK